MGRPRKPTAVLELAGAFKHDPKRAREREQEPKPKGGLGDPPKCLNKDEVEHWKAIRKSAFWLTDADRYIVEQTCRLIELERDRKASTSEKSLLAANLRALGMTPGDRSRIKVPTKPEKPTGQKAQAPANPFKRLHA